MLLTFRMHDHCDLDQPLVFSTSLPLFLIRIVLPPGCILAKFVTSYLSPLNVTMIFSFVGMPVSDFVRRSGLSLPGSLGD